MEAGVADGREAPGLLRQALWGFVALLVVWVGSFALLVLDEIAKLKRTDAIVCEVSNWRISDRLLTRWGWESHLGESRRRHFIKRFYGDYTAVTDRWIQDK